PETLLGGLTPEAFLREYWQQKPLLVRGAWPGFTSPLAPEELAGLACEDDVTSRLLLERGGDGPWQMRFGPFDPDDFAALPASHWTLLVQEVDRLVPDVADVLDAFRFLPNWRIDDVQISYAPPEGNAGAHLDNYDVFLLQGLGRRRWRYGAAPIPPDEERYVPDLDVRLLAGFEAAHEAVLEPGDLLYLPPRVAHHGVALDACMTYSIGFRAPTQAELLEGFAAFAADAADPHARYADPALDRPTHVGDLPAPTRRAIRDLLRRALADDDAIDRWFGRYVTEPRRGLYAAPLGEPVEPGELAAMLAEGLRLRRAAVAAFAFFEEDGGGARLFAGGAEYALHPDLAWAAPLITGTIPLTAAALGHRLEDPDFLGLLAELVNEGHLIVDE
ncbi:MAG: cupin domain-containing protein, partial [Rhodothermales bacterium]|nr:cupin domain-containing protein [Rhodothermales bacterium]